MTTQAFPAAMSDPELRAVEPLERTAKWQLEPPETYPTAL